MTVGGQPLQKETHYPTCRTLGGPQGQNERMQITITTELSQATNFYNTVPLMS